MGLVEGSIAVKAVINSKYRIVNKIYINKEKKGSDVAFIVNQAQKKKIKVEKVDQEIINQIANGKTHGGLVADVSERKTQSIVALLKKDKPFIVLLEGVEDSFNLGYIFRTLYAFGCDGIIMKERYIDYDDSIIIKSSAGASEFLPIVYSNDLAGSIEILKNNGITVVSAYRGKNPVNLYDYDFFNKGLLVCIGGPLRGLSKVVLDNSDNFIYIPYSNDFKNSLNAASATSVIASEIYRQNR
ncbi:MAG TPA: RNA methyltransferase [Erysipelotrichaceae bacterium]|jgi:23S rRNA (guanosine2251-2'-O)-methyltransferase|nr:RNA methyltransferase [Erysipelotrichaceae bacterium]HQA85780.1 RNA methyltransferase [Erysipelotrichaceae bacterium]